jgi:hypothetical protein
MWLSEPPTRQILTARKPTEWNYFSIIGLIDNTYEQAKELLNISRYISRIIIQIQHVTQRFFNNLKSKTSLKENDHFLLQSAYK